MKVLWVGILAALLSTGACDDSKSTHDADVSVDDGGSTIDAASDASSATSAPVCVEHCEGGGTCSPGSSCNGTICVLTKSVVSCEDRNDCIPSASFWSSGSACSTADGCSIIEECVDMGNSGRCVRKPTESNPDVCANRGTANVMWPNIEGTTVTVCGVASADCDEGVCVPACTESKECTRSSLPVCNQETNRCVCAVGSCSSIKGSACLPSGECGCTDNGDCTRIGFDQCYNGVCGCAGPETCADIIDKPLVCEPLE